MSFDLRPYMSKYADLARNTRTAEVRIVRYLLDTLSCAGITWKKSDEIIWFFSRQRCLLFIWCSKTGLCVMATGEDGCKAGMIRGNFLFKESME